MNEHKPILMITGPMPLHPDVLASISTQMINHRGDKFKQIFSETVTLAKNVFKTNNDVLILPCSGTGGLEAVVSNFMSPGDHVILGLNGFFGDCFSNIMKAYGIEPIRIAVEWGKPILVKDVVETLTQYPRVNAVVIIHNETSTGVISNIAKIAKAVKAINPNILMIVDAISSLGGTEVKTDEWGLDVVVSASQKALMAPPGLCLMTVSETAWEVSKSSSLPKYYFDLHKIKQEGLQGMTFVTPPIPIVFGLKRALELLLKTGLETVFQKNIMMRNMILQAIQPIDLTLVADKEYASPTMSALRLPRSISSQKFRDHIEAKYSVVLASGLGILSQDCFRIGHMGDITLNNINETITALEKSLKYFQEFGNLKYNYL
jgi:aspartate aminotransferase-like enzyme